MNNPNHTSAADFPLPPFPYLAEHKQTLERFIVGSSNGLAHQAAMEIIENPGRSNNLLFIYGGSGVGKTHLMLAIGNQLYEQNKQIKIGFVSAFDFVRHVVTAYRWKKLEALYEQYLSLDLLLIDDIQLLSEKLRMQELLLHVLETLLRNGKQVVLTANSSSSELEEFDERLLSLLHAGLTVPINVPEFDLCTRILKQEADALGIELDDQTASHLADQGFTDVRRLNGALKHVYAHSRFHNKKISVELAKEVLRD